MSSDGVTSDFLFVRPTMFRGLARTLDLVGSLDSYNWSGTGAEADARAMAADWSLVGADLAAAMSRFALKPTDSVGNEQLKLIETDLIR